MVAIDPVSISIRRLAGPQAKLAANVLDSFLGRKLEPGRNAEKKPLVPCASEHGKMRRSLAECGAKWADARTYNKISVSR